MFATVLTTITTIWRPGLSGKDRKHMFANRFFKFSTNGLVFHIVVIIAGIHISQEIFAIDIKIFAALKPSLEHDRKHIVRLLEKERLYGDSN